MLIAFDDYPVHQTAEALSYMASSERNMYARYWYNGYVYTFRSICYQYSLYGYYYNWCKGFIG